MEIAQRDRRNAKRAFDRAKQQIEQLIGAKSHLNYESLATLEHLIEEARTSYVALRNAIDEICNSLEGDESSAEYDAEILACSEKMSAFIGKFKSFRRNFEKSESRDSLIPVPEELNKTIKSLSVQPKLQKIDIPTFDGDILAFGNFKALFENLVHRNDSLSNVQKLFYLKRACTGVVGGNVRDFQLNDEGYILAWDYLLSNYDNKRIVTSTLFTKLMEIEPIKSETKIRQLLDRVEVVVRGFQAAGLVIDDLFSKFLVFWTVRLLDPGTARDWNHSLGAQDCYPKFEDLRKFLQARSFAAEERVNSKPKLESTKKAFISLNRPNPEPATTSRCYCCESSDHRIADCNRFKRLSPQDRYGVCKRNKLCLICLSGMHTAKTCTGSKCSQCQGMHNSMLHFEFKKTKAPTVSKEVAEKPQTSFHSSISDKTVILPTAVVRVAFGDKKPILARLLLDSGSQVSFITDRLVRKLNIPTVRFEKESVVAGVGDVTLTSTHSCEFVISSRIADFSIVVEADVIATISYTSPRERLNELKKKYYSHMFADDVLSHNQVDIILGAEYSELCFEEGSALDCTVKLRNSKFGFVVSGSMEGSVSPLRSCNLSTLAIDEALKRFWEIEECTAEIANRSDQQQCVSHFKENCRRDAEGRFVVRLPIKGDPSSLSDTTFYATKALKKVESLPVEIRLKYREFLREYLSLNHMEKVPIDELPLPHRYVIPHRAVLRPESSSTKLRVVFNASSRSLGKPSLNDILMIGPKTQPDLFDILLRFRSFRFVFSADIEKMYRQVLVDNRDRNLQCIFWRDSPDQEIELYRLLTVTYGTSSASYLATSCLNLLGQELSESSPIASESILKGFYMDDLLAGSDSLSQLLELQKIIHEKLAEACFHLRKYASNCSELLDSLEPELIEPLKKVPFRDESVVSTLGLKWDPESDAFKVFLNLPILPDVISKRSLLSFIARLFDPLGFLCPVTLRAKLFLQDVWREELSWDQPVSKELEVKFRNFYSELSSLLKCSIRRPYSKLSDVVDKQLVGFADASTKAYCAVIYLRTVDRFGNIDVYFVTAKTRVAPLKEQTVPRLELQAALLLSELADRVVTALQLRNVTAFFFSDSKIVLGWLNKPPTNWNVFVANRVAKIVKNYKPDRWAHVDTELNPADLATRGVNVRDFLDNSLWFYGPKFVQNDIDSVFGMNLSVNTNIDFDSLPEKKRFVKASNVVSQKSNDLIFDKFSSYTRIINVYAYVLRFIENSKPKSKVIDTHRNCSVILSVDEIDRSFKVLVKIHQTHYFGSDPTKNNCLASLDPFVDQEGIFRVGGRLRRSAYSLNLKHPIIMFAKCNFVYIYVKYLHEKYFHAGKLFLKNFVRLKFWIVGSLDRIVKCVLTKCVLCVRLKGETYNQIMGQLPVERTVISRPFSCSGVDFAGPFATKCVNHRSTKYGKSYAAIFICFSTRAVHIEVVSELTTASFIASFRRFTARRGLPNTVVSDNATNFVGTNNVLILNRSEILDFTSQEGIRWQFIPPGSPHHGGIWEAAVKSAKFYLVRAASTHVLSFEELVTYFSQIEAVLNSRPLCYKTTSEDGSLEALTPSHFLVGSIVTLIPDFETQHLTKNARWCVLQRIIRSFNAQWRSSYLAQLQKRGKWTKRAANPKIDQIVILKEENLHPLHWKLGRIVNLYPDSEGNIRIVDVKTNSGIKRRSIVKLVPLPVENPVKE